MSNTDLFTASAEYVKHHNGRGQKSVAAVAAADALDTVRALYPSVDLGEILGAFAAAFGVAPAYVGNALKLAPHERRAVIEGRRPIILRQ